jgi:hypothetical protein
VPRALGQRAQRLASRRWSLRLDTSPRSCCGVVLDHGAATSLPLRSTLTSSA